ncbi:unnamed protein product [Cylindrotheca closterium]|uniref:3-hydroxyisobutyryl-CoA hydrolase n=1 Tax=Cylindrotheca closterium TaxID=2856 RepID=A0AAD2FZB6_9STRA|nr:unnamed protein product [Cylindrotheca closterium]
MEPHRLDSQFKFLKLSEPRPGVVVVQLDRPRKRNAINTEGWQEIGDVFTSVAQDGACRCIVLSGIGKDFSAGIDITDPGFFSFNDSDADVARRGLSFLPKVKQMQDCFTAVEKCPVPVIAAIHGNCIGAGVDIACCCDVRLAAPETTFSVREVKIGLAADIGTLQRLPKITGNDSRVRELCYTGEFFSSQEALSIGFISRICPNPLAGAIELATKIAASSPVAVHGTKKSLMYSRDHSVAEGLEHVAMHNSLALMTDDVPEAHAASANKENPSFSNMLPFSKL